MSRNAEEIDVLKESALVAPREGRVSRNIEIRGEAYSGAVAPREGRVSRNCDDEERVSGEQSRPARGV